MTRPLRLLMLRTLLIGVLTACQPQQRQRPGAPTSPAVPFTCAAKVAEDHLSGPAPGGAPELGRRGVAPGAHHQGGRPERPGLRLHE